MKATKAQVDRLIEGGCEISRSELLEMTSEEIQPLFRKPRKTKVTEREKQTNRRLAVLENQVKTLFKLLNKHGISLELDPRDAAQIKWAKEDGEVS